MSKVKKQGPLGLKQRWSVRRKQEVVLRLLAGFSFPRSQERQNRRQSVLGQHMQYEVKRTGGKT